MRFQNEQPLVNLFCLPYRLKNMVRLFLHHLLLIESLHDSRPMLGAGSNSRVEIFQVFMGTWLWQGEADQQVFHSLFIPTFARCLSIFVKSPFLHLGIYIVQSRCRGDLGLTRWAMPHWNLEVAIPWDWVRACVVLSGDGWTRGSVFECKRCHQGVLQSGGSCVHTITLPNTNVDHYIYISIYFVCTVYVCVCMYVYVYLHLPTNKCAHMYAYCLWWYMCTLYKLYSMTIEYLFSYYLNYNVLVAHMLATFNKS